jgi:hypothetical protein
MARRRRILFSQEAGGRGFHYIRTSSEKLRRAVASTREQQRHSGHPAFLADGTDIDVDPADSDQLFLPGLRPAVFFSYGFASSKDITTYCDGIVPVSVCQHAEVTYPYIA